MTPIHGHKEARKELGGPFRKYKKEFLAKVCSQSEAELSLPDTRSSHTRSLHVDTELTANVCTACTLAVWKGNEHRLQKQSSS